MRRVVALYGRLRDAGLGDSVTLELAGRPTAKAALAALRAALGRKGALLDGCALATADAVLSSSDPIPARGPLAALPPVCGG